MVETIKLLDVVALTVDLPEYNLWRGQIGTVVEVLRNGTAFEVEFSDRSGRTRLTRGSNHGFALRTNHYLSTGCNSVVDP
jgi:hypothetical protein